MYQGTTGFAYVFMHVVVLKKIPYENFGKQILISGTPSWCPKFLRTRCNIPSNMIITYDIQCQKCLPSLCSLGIGRIHQEQWDTC
jgi:hypothetical protein